MAEPAVVVEHQMEWAGIFARVAGALRRELQDAAVRIDHIGSTAIRGLAAKPVVDIQVSVISFEPLVEFRAPIERAGFIYRGDNPDLTKRYFRELPGERRTHIHVRELGSFSEQFALLFRDYLRTNHARAAEYAALKYALAAQFGRPEDRGAYVDGKEPFIWETMRVANRWAQSTGWAAPPSDA